MGSAKRLGDDFILSDVDLERLTGASHRDAQCAALRRMGIHHRQNTKGYPIVTRDAVRSYTGETASNDHDGPTLNLGALNGAKA